MKHAPSRRHIAIVGGGFTGLTASRELLRRGYRITLFEKEKTLGGLAAGFRESDWNWHLEYAYHHFFTNDTALIRLMRDLGLKNDMIISRPKTKTYWKGRAYQLDSPASLLTFAPLPVSDRIRTGMLLAGCKANPLWRPLEAYSARHIFKTLGGKAGWDIIWEPLLKGKFDSYEPEINAAWLWARIKKRTSSLGYIRGGFQHVVTALASDIRNRMGTIRTGTPVDRIVSRNPEGGCTLFTGHEQIHADAVLVTSPSPVFVRMVPDLPRAYAQGLLSIPHLSAQLLILRTKEPILKDVYWLNINDRSFPFLAAVAHTNFVSPAYYGNTHLTYFGNYLPENHPYLKYSKQKLLTLFLPYIQSLNPNSNFKILKSYLFSAPYAQPVHTKHYSRKAPRLETPVPNLFLANMDSIIPWDRGTNYSVELGNTAAQTIGCRY